MRITEEFAINYLQSRGYVVITKETEDLYIKTIRDMNKLSELYEKANAQYLRVSALHEENKKLVDEIKSGKIWLE